MVHIKKKKKNLTKNHVSSQLPKHRSSLVYNLHGYFLVSSPQVRHWYSEVVSQLSELESMLPFQQAQDWFYFCSSLPFQGFPCTLLSRSYLQKASYAFTSSKKPSLAYSKSHYLNCPCWYDTRRDPITPCFLELAACFLPSVLLFEEYTRNSQGSLT